jgi:hypothetical protein
MQALVSGSEVFECDELPFKQRVEFFATHIDLIRSSLDQHEGGKLLGA